MGLKILDYGLFGTGKTAFAASMAEVCDIGVVDTESRWQYYTDQHPTVKPRLPSPAALARGVPASVYANPRRIRQDKPWLPKSDHVIWLVQTMDPTEAWECRKIWGSDKSIGGQVCDSASVIWDMLQDSRETVSESGKELGGLSWAPVKRVDRRMTYTILETGQHFIACAHKQEIMNKKMEVTGSRPWTEKRMSHWFDLVLQSAYGSEDPTPKVRIEEEKILGGVGDALKKGTVIQAPTFKQILTLAGDRAAVTAPTSQDKVDAATERLINKVAAMPPISGVDDVGPQGGKQ